MDIEIGDYVTVVFDRTTKCGKVISFTEVLDDGSPKTIIIYTPDGIKKYWTTEKNVLEITKSS